MGIRRDEVIIVKNRLTQVGLSFRSGAGYERSAVFVCQCGVRLIVGVTCVRSGKSKSCGCIQKEHARRLGNEARHGHARTKQNTRTYTAWCGMHARVGQNKSNPAYEGYAGRGISCCSEWDSYEVFLSDMGECPKGLSLDRIDNDGNYQKSNCRWATRKDQNRNTRKNVILTHNGKTQCIAAWAEEIGISHKRISARLKRGWSVHRALTEPLTWRGVCQTNTKSQSAR